VEVEVLVEHTTAVVVEPEVAQVVLQKKAQGELLLLEELGAQSE
jgi:hypothetical protein